MIQFSPIVSLFTENQNVRHFAGVRQKFCNISEHVRIQHDRSISTRSSNLVLLAVSRLLVCWHVVHCLTPSVIGKPHCNLIQDHMLYVFEQGHYAAETAKKICCAKGESAIDLSTLPRWLKKFCTGCKNIDDHARCRGGMYLVISVDMRPYFTSIALNIISTTNTTQNFTIA